MNKNFIIITAALTMISCSTQELYLNVVEPAPVTIPPYIKSVGLAHLLSVRVLKLSQDF